MQVSLYYIRHKPTGFIIGMAKGMRGKGGSHLEPQSPLDAIPRFFRKEGRARAHLTTWLLGKQSALYTHEGEHDGNKIEKVSSRIKEEMEIAKIEINI